MKIFTCKDLINNYIDFLLSVPTIFQESYNNISDFNGSLEKYLNQLKNNNELKALLEQYPPTFAQNELKL